MATQVIVYVDPDAGGAGTGADWTNAYTALETAENAEKKNISLSTGSNEQYTFLCRSSGGTNDTTNTVFAQADWNSESANYVEVMANDFPEDGIYDDTLYVLENQSGDVATYALVSDLPYFRCHDIQVLALGATNFNYGIELTPASAGDTWLYNINLQAPGLRCWAVAVNHASATVKIWNCIFYQDSPAASAYGLVVLASSTVDVFNCSYWGWTTGLASSGGTVTVKNCAVGESTDDFGAGLTIDYCCSDDGDGTNSNGPLDGLWSKEYVDVSATTWDFTPIAGGNILAAGLNDPGSGLYSTDIIGASYVTDSWTRGAYNGVAATGGRQLVNYGGAINSKLLVGRIG